MKLDHAEILANRIVLQLLPYCDKIDIAGSVRRECAEVNDIEIVCFPKTIIFSKDLFGKPDVRRDPDFIQAILLLGKRLKGHPYKDRYTRIQIGDICADIFMPQSYDYYRMLAIRTGSKDYSHVEIACRWKSNGWTGTPDGLRLQVELDNPPHDGVYTLPPEWESEKHFFEWMGVKYVEPKNRFL
jgi:DNA polymerase/3'-5' exonuclease PolX